MRIEFVSSAVEDTSLCAEVLELLRHHQNGGREGAGPELSLPERIGPYRILGLLGRGGMGIVYRAETDDGQAVALKVLEPGILAGRFLGRFRRETEALRRLDHPGIARFLDAGTYDSPMGARPYYAMELIEGCSLRQRAGDAGWSDRERIALLADLAEALDHAHEQGVVHRDLKPDNVVVTPSGKPKVLDFGVARITAGDLKGGTLATVTGVLLGTVRYMSPEQAQGLSDEVDRRSDVYALGVLAYELLSGGPPYELHTRSVTRALVQVATLTPKPLGELRPALRGPIERVVARALEKDPEDRYPTAAEFAAELRRVLAGERVRTPGPPLGERLARVVRRSPWAASAAALAVLAIAAFATRGLWPGAEPSRAEADAAAATACALLDSADARLHGTTRTRASLARVLELLGQADRMIDGTGRNGYATDLRRYTAWRRGEAYFFLAEFDGDPDGFLRAAQAWSHAREPARPVGYRVPLPDTSVNLFPRLTRVRPSQADGGMGLAYAQVARYRQPAVHSRLALLHHRAAWEILAREGGFDPDPLRATLPDGDRSLYTRALNDLGAAWTATGYFADSLDVLETGLRILQRATTVASLGEDVSARASLQHHLGRAFLWRGRMRRSPQDADSAIARLGNALADRSLLRGDASALVSRIVLAEAWRLRARLEPLPVRQRACIRRAETLLAEGRRSPIESGTPALRALEAMSLAGARVDAAAITGDTLAIATAESLLDSAATIMTRARYTVAYSRIERERGRIETLRWSLGGNAGHWIAATEHLTAANEALTASQDVTFRRDLDAAANWLGKRPTRRPTLLDPIFWP